MVFIPYCAAMGGVSSVVKRDPPDGCLMHIIAPFFYGFSENFTLRRTFETLTDFYSLVGCVINRWPGRLGWLSGYEKRRLPGGWQPSIGPGPFKTWINNTQGIRRPGYRNEKRKPAPCR
jgi:hypothetical protein